MTAILRHRGREGASTRLAPIGTGWHRRDGPG